MLSEVFRVLEWLCRVFVIACGVSRFRVLGVPVQARGFRLEGFQFKATRSFSPQHPAEKSLGCVARIFA